MIVHYQNTLFFRAWLLEDLKSQPLDTFGYTALCVVKKSNDTDESLFTFTSDGEEAPLMFYKEGDETSLSRSWLELKVTEFDIAPGDYVFYAYINTPSKQVIEHCHMLVLSFPETEVTP